MNKAAPPWATPRPRPCFTLGSHAATFWATTHSAEPCRTLSSHAELYWTPPQLTGPSRALISHAKPADPRRTLWVPFHCTDIKENQIFLIYRKFRMEQLQSHIWLTAPHKWGNICAFPHILGSPSSYMTLQLIHSEFPYIWGKFDFLFYQCALWWVTPHLLAEPRRTLLNEPRRIPMSHAATCWATPQNAELRRTLLSHLFGKVQSILEKRYIDVPGRISLFSLSFLVLGFQRSSPALCSQLNIGSRDYTLHIPCFSFPLYMHTVLLGRVFDQKGARAEEKRHTRANEKYLQHAWIKKFHVQFPLRFEHVLMNIPVFFCRKFPVLHSTAYTLHIYTTRVTYI